MTTYGIRFGILPVLRSEQKIGNSRGVIQRKKINKKSIDGYCSVKYSGNEIWKIQLEGVVFLSSALFSKAVKKLHRRNINELKFCVPHPVN